MSIYEIVSAIAAVVSAVAAVAGFKGLRRQLEHTEQADARERVRVRQQATLELVMGKFSEVRDLRESLRPLLLRDLDPAKVCELIIESDHANTASSYPSEVRADRRLGELTRRYLTYLEFIAIGVGKDILDRDVVHEMSGRHFLNVYRRMHLYIKHAQGNNRKSAYSNFVKLVREWYPEETTEAAPTSN